MANVGVHSCISIRPKQASVYCGSVRIIFFLKDDIADRHLLLLLHSMTLCTMFF